MKIIVVDDEMEALSNFLLQIINERRIEYKFFMDKPMDAIDYCKTNEVDAAFLDIRMPEINGVDLAYRLVLQNPNIKIVFITGYASDEKAIRDRIGSNLLGFCYKPFNPDILNSYIDQIASEGKKEVRFKTFGPFDVFLNDTIVPFSSTKAKELLALLVVYTGSTLTMNDALYHLWPEKKLSLAKTLYRDAIWRMRKTLKDYGIAQMVIFERGKTTLNPNNLSCDYWDALDGKPVDYNGEFLVNYDWTLDFQEKLDKKLATKKKIKE